MAKIIGVNEMIEITRTKFNLISGISTNCSATNTIFNTFNSSLILENFVFSDFHSKLIIISNGFSKVDNCSFINFNGIVLEASLVIGAIDSSFIITNSVFENISNIAQKVKN